MHDMLEALRVFLYVHVRTGCRTEVEQFTQEHVTKQNKTGQDSERLWW